MENQDNTTLILVVGVCFSCMLSLAVLVFAYYQGWLDNIIEWFNGEEETAATPPEDTPPEDTTPEDTTPEDTTPEDTTPEDTTPEDTTPETPPTNTNECDPNNPNKQCTNKSGYRHVCPEPWKRGFLKYSRDGKGTRCCTDKNQLYGGQNCKKEAIAVPDGFPTDVLHKTATTTLSGKIKGPLRRGTCPDGSGADSIVYEERNSRGHVQQTWCHPVSAKQAYAVYPMCYTANNGNTYAKSTGSDKDKPPRIYANKSAKTCTNNKTVRWETYNKASEKGDRHRYVKWGTN